MRDDDQTNIEDRATQLEAEFRKIRDTKLTTNRNI